MFLFFVRKKEDKGKKWDYARVHYASDVRVFVPEDESDLAKYLSDPQRIHETVCIKGAGYSHGGNTLSNDSTQVDMRNIRNMRYFPASQLVVVEAGATWRHVLLYLAEHDRTVAEMQSYHNFSVGGSVSVNCHGRGVRYGSISDTIVSLRVCDAKGRVWTCSDEKNPELFRGVIGGYALLGIIVEVTLITVPNELLCQKIVPNVPVNFTDDLLASEVGDPKTVLFNAVLYPDRYDKLVGYSWKRSDKTTVSTEGLPVCDIGPSYSHYAFMLFEQILRRVPGVNRMREFVEPVIEARNTTTPAKRSFVTATDATRLHGFVRFPTTTVLQEYFVPARRIREALVALVPLFKKINIINVSLRYVKRVSRSVLNYAPVDSVSIVLYVNVWNTANGLRAFGEWTDAVLTLIAHKNIDGRFYLPYLLSYDASVVRSMYGDAWKEMTRLKGVYDPGLRFRNLMYDHLVR
jgi:FAD/FMN-containing dehydrogenase